MAGNITLFSIPGISRFDEPMFTPTSGITAKERQLQFFTRFMRSVPEDGFYVPKFKDTIKLYVNNVNIGNVGNYLSLDFAGRRYYYFIDSITYISEDTYELTISLDVIQTYWYDITFYKFERTRTLIKRWVNGLINRNYLRENLSEGLFQLHNHKVYTSPTSFTDVPSKFYNQDYDHLTGIISMVRTEYPNMPKRSLGNVVGDSYSRKIYSSYFISFIPIVNNELRNDNIKAYWYPFTGDPNNPVYENIKPFKGFYDNISDAEMIRAFYLPFNPIYNFGQFGSQFLVDKVNIDPADNMLFINNTSGEDTGASILIVPYTDIQYLGIRDTSTPTTAFDPLLVPAMLDENYVRISFGEANYQATYPLYMATEDRFECRYVGNPFSGARYYNIKAASTLAYASSTKLFDDRYLSSVCAAEPLSLDVVTDSWKQYWAYNTGSFMTAMASSTIKAVTGFGAGKSIQNAGTDYYRTLFRLADNGDDQTRILGASDRDYNIRGVHTINQSVDNASSIINFTSGAINSALAPDSPKASGIYWSDMVSGVAVISCSWYMVNDFDEVARMYESNGYKVHEINFNADPYIQNRYYYDVICCDNCVFGLYDMSIELQQEIKDRLRQGFRAWHTKHNRETLIMNIEEVDLQLGCTCCYDNTEV